MNEFNNRMDAQRTVLNIINTSSYHIEELCGLSKNAIDRWIYANQLNPEDTMCDILFQISKKLFFLANKSQEQISEEYKTISSELSELKNKLERTIR